jgi:hypothetical protein
MDFSREGDNIGRRNPSCGYYGSESILSPALFPLSSYLCILIAAHLSILEGRILLKYGNLNGQWHLWNV